MRYEEFYRTYFPSLTGNVKQKTATCPFCGHKNDFSINTETGQCKCFYGGCGFEGDAFDFLMKSKNLTFSEAKKELAEYGIHPLGDNGPKEKKRTTEKQLRPIPEDQIAGYTTALSDDGIQYLREMRGLSREVIVRYGIGWCEKKERFTIPISRNGEYVNVRLYHPNKNPKVLPISSGRSTQLYPEDQLKNDELWLCEGELDALCGISNGLPAVSVTGGARSWKDEFTTLLRDKKVNIVYDCDEAGSKGADKIAGTLHKAAHVKVISLGLRNKEDLTDWFVTYGRTRQELEKLAERTPVFKKLTKAEKKTRDNALKLASQSISVKELLESELPEEEFLIGKGLIPKGGYALLAGLAKEGKTTLALQMGLHLVSATPFLEEFPIESERRVLYLYAENTLSGLNKILRKQTAGLSDLGFKIDADDLSRFILQETKGFFLDTSEGSEYLDELISIHGPDVVFVDPISLFTKSNMNKLENATKMVTNLGGIASRRDCSWVLIHHFRKPSRDDVGEPIHKVIGSSGFANYCDTFIGIERTHKQRSSNFKTLHFTLRREEAPEPICVYRHPDTLLSEPRKGEELVRSVTIGNVVGVLKKEFKGKSAYTPLVTVASHKFGVTKTRIAELLKEAQDEGFIAKEPGKFGKYYAL